MSTALGGKQPTCLAAGCWTGVGCRPAACCWRSAPALTSCNQLHAVSVAKLTAGLGAGRPAAGRRLPDRRPVGRPDAGDAVRAAAFGAGSGRGDGAGTGLGAGRPAVPAARIGAPQLSRNTASELTRHGKPRPLRADRVPGCPVARFTIRPGAGWPATAEQLIDWRRDLHAHPEVAYAEHRTTELIMTTLAGFGLAAAAAVHRHRRAGGHRPRTGLHRAARRHRRVAAARPQAGRATPPAIRAPATPAGTTRTPRCCWPSPAA